ncbi:MAG: amidophosphoribosyltransferase [Parcubacteria bacterium C7867-001]|nr:MAG: amidophosphoribosyltransferase [Parcubacteria bacterium C7867-001]
MCGIFAVFDMPKAAELTVMGLHGLQHRAQDFAGIVSTDGVNFYRERGAGVTRNVFSDPAVLDRLHGHTAVGHIRYSTRDDKDDHRRDNTQPVIGIYADAPIAIAHNGNLTNIPELEGKFPEVKCATSMDTEWILQLLRVFATGDLCKDLASVFPHLRGSYSLVILYKDRLIAVRDPSGNRPLWIGRINGGYVVASETCAFANVDALTLQRVKPGSMVSIGSEGLEEILFSEPRLRHCCFEDIYFSNPASKGVMEFRKRLGAALEASAPASADVVVPIPDSANFIAEGYAKSGRSGTYSQLILRNHYVGRTFTAATQARRDEEVARKFLFAGDEIRGKRLVLIDDSIVRGTTLPKIVSKLRMFGALEVHVRIGSPPITHACWYGMDFPDEGKLIATHHNPNTLASFVGADSLEYLPLAELKKLYEEPEHRCFACMDGQYWS